METVLTKLCPKCRETKLAEDFNKHKSNRYGLDCYCKACKKKHRDSKRDYYLAKAKVYQKANKQRIKEVKRKRYLKKREQILAKVNEYRLKNREKINKARQKNERKRYYSDPVFKTAFKLRRRINIALRNHEQGTRSKTLQSVGLKSWRCLYEHLKNTAIRNYGYFDSEIGYHVDHIIPLSSAKTPEEVIQLNHYMNLQFLTAQDNFKKSNRMPEC